MSESAASPRDTPSFERVLAAFLQAVESGKKPDRAKLLRRFPHIAAELKAYFDNADRLDAIATPAPATALHTPTDLTTPPPPAFADYEILEKIAEGGMGVVYKAKQRSAKRFVALKMILPRPGMTDEDVTRFRQEAEAAAQRRHPHIVRIYDVGTMTGPDGNPRPYFTMDLIEGGSLSQSLKERQAAGVLEKTSLWAAEQRRVADMMATVARAVHFAHQHRILHRDLKPSNVLLDSECRPHLTDFGLAKRLEGGAGLTQTGAIVGTPGYLAPEQASNPKGVTTAADVYGLGAILYECLTGRPPFQAETPLDTVLQTLDHDPKPPSRLNPRAHADLETICLKCLAREPERRYRSAEAVADDLDRWREGRPILARRVGRLERAGLWCRRKPAVAGLMAAMLAVLLIGLGGAGAVWLWQRAEDQRMHADAARRKAEADELKTKLANTSLAVSLNEAEAEKQAEADARRKLAHASYLRQVSLAHREFQAGESARATALLRECPPEHRRWEWYHVYRLCNRSRLISNATAIKGSNISIWGLCFSLDGRWLAGIASDTANVKVWDASTGQETLTLKGRGDGVVSVCFSPDGQRVAAGNKDGTVEVWDRAAGQELLTLRGHAHHVRSVCFSPDGRRLASASADQSAKVWDAVAGQEILTLKGGFRSICFGPEGRQLACAPMNGPVTVWDVTTGQELLTLKKRSVFDVDKVCFSPDGWRLACAYHDENVTVWDIATGQEAYTLKDAGASVCFSPDSKRLASNFRAFDPTVKVWDAATGQETLTLTGHSGSVVRGMCFSPDGQRLAYVTEDRSVQQTRGRPTMAVWEARTEQEILSPEGHTGPITTMCFSSDGRRLASGSSGGTIMLLDASTGKETHTLQRDGGQMVLSVCFSPDGRRLASASNSLDPGFKVWDTATGRVVLTLKESGGSHPSVCFSPDGRYLATATGNFGDTAKVWDAATGQQTLTLKGHKGQMGLVKGVCFSPDGQRLAGACGDGTAKVWDAATGQEIVALKGHRLSPLTVCFSPDGKSLASACRDGIVKVWDLATEKETLTIKGHGSDVTSVCFSPDGRRLASASHFESVKVWDAATGKETLTFKGRGGFDCVCFSPDGRRLAGAGYADAKVWDATTGQEAFTFKGGRGRDLIAAPAVNDGDCACFSPDGRRLASAFPDGIVEVWDLTGGRGTLTLKRHGEGIHGICFSPDGRRLASASWDATVKIWDAGTGAETLTIKEQSSIRPICFSSDGRRLAGGTIDGTVKVWDASTGGQVLTLKGHRSGITSVCFSPDGRWLATALGNKAIKVWEASNGQETRTLKGHGNGSILSMCFSPDSQQLGFTSGVGILEVWDVSTGKEVFTVKDPTGTYGSLCFSPDGQRLATALRRSDERGANLPGEVKVWDTVTGQEALTLATGHAHEITCVQFSPDGKKLACASTNQIVKVWFAADEEEVARNEPSRAKP